ncbi:MAG: hypothetical protein HC904_07475 [Blastochloris sp.]|nr:hypothetical protein [Blastochloris sp.]
MRILEALRLIGLLLLFLVQPVAGSAPELSLSEAAKIAETILAKNKLSENYYLVSLTLIRRQGGEWHYLADYNFSKDFNISGAGGQGEDRFIKIDSSGQACFLARPWFMPWKDGTKKEFGAKTYGEMTEIQPSDSFKSFPPRAPENQ